MAALSNSGHRLIPTDEHEAIQLRQAGLSLQKTTPMKAIQVNNPISPLPAVASDWSSPSVLRQAPSQVLKEPMLAQTSFKLNFHGLDFQRSLTEASLEEFLLFCNQCNASAIDYSEGGAYPALSRRDFANAQMIAGKMLLLLAGNEADGQARYILVSSKVKTHVLTCSDLAVSEWGKHLCCGTCHEDHDFFDCHLASDNEPLEGKKGRRRAILCCRAERLVDEYYPGRVFSDEELATHDIEDCVSKE